MRLLHAKDLVLQNFSDDSAIPPYAILSHTWGNDEITLQDVLSLGFAGLRHRECFLKIEGCCRQAVADGLEHVWVDTCCIDKTSSAELSEAINSMFRWYREAACCYAYLADVLLPPLPHEEDDHDDDDNKNKNKNNENQEQSPFFPFDRSSRWFSRGWTLQELLAPRDVVFFDLKWRRIGSKLGHLSELERVTGIGRRFLQNTEELQRASVAQRMSWASNRQTTRSEDRAYCLLGIFGINMPLLYGEGDRAFVRLQEEIMRDSDDQSLFAWGLGVDLESDGRGRDGGLFARSPEAFRRGHTIQFWGQLSASTPTHHFMTNKGLRIELPLLAEGPDNETAYAVLDCISENKFVAVPISRAYHDDVYQRTRGSSPRTISRKTRKRAVRKLIYLQKGLPGSSLTMYFSTITVYTKSLHESRFRLVDVYPPHAALDIQSDLVRCGDSHRVLLVFQHADRPRRRVALLVTALYSHEKNYLSRPVLEHVSSRIAVGPRLGRLVDLVLDHSIWHIERHLNFGEEASVHGQLVTTRTVKEEGTASWAVQVAAHGTPTPLLAPEAPWHEQDSESDGFEHISMAAIAAMFNNTNRDFRQREAWVRRQEQTRLRKKWWTNGLLAVASCGVALLAVIFAYVAS